MKLVDVPDSKSGVVHPTCRFDSGHRQIKRDTNVSLFIWLMQELHPKAAALSVRRERAEAEGIFFEAAKTRKENPKCR